MIEIQAPRFVKNIDKAVKLAQVAGKVKTIFLGGSIDMGKAIDWQKEIVKSLKDDAVLFFNPRRDDFDPTLVQSKGNPPFREQVEWELEALENSDIIVFYFDPKGKAPVTMLELGLFTHDKTCKVIVCCEEGFWRKGNVDIVCERYGIEQVNSLQELIARIQELIAS